MARTVLCFTAMIGFLLSCEAAGAPSMGEADVQAERLLWAVGGRDAWARISDLETRGVRYPTWISRPDGGWRVAMKTLAVNVAMSDDLFAPPRTLTAVDQ